MRLLWCPWFHLCNHSLNTVFENMYKMSPHFLFFYTCAGVRIYQSIRIIKWSERYPFGLYNETFMWFPYTVPGGLSVSTSIIRVSFSASLNLLLICSIWQLIKLVDALASHIQMYWLETSDDSSKLASKVCAFHVNANFDPDLINSGAMCQLENSKPKFCFLWLASLPTIKESWMGFFSTSWRRRCCCC